MRFQDQTGHPRNRSDLFQIEPESEVFLYRFHTERCSEVIFASYCQACYSLNTLGGGGGHKIGDQVYDYDGRWPEFHSSILIKRFCEHSCF
jgi:hypothetical protein